MANDMPPPPPPPPPPSPPAPPGVPKAAYVEEYNEEAETSNPATRQTANISTKRSKPNVAITKAPYDGVSDSGYSSHTAGTLGSSATSLESKTGSNPPKIEKNTAASKRRPTGVENLVKSRSHSPQKPSIPRTRSDSLRKRHSQSKQPCNCSECVAQARRSSAALEVSKQHESRPKPTSRRTLGELMRPTRPPPAQVVPIVPILQPVQARPRASTQQPHYRAARPASFHAGAIAPEHVFVQQPFVIERQPTYPGPPLFPPPSYPPQQSYFPPPPQPVSVPQNLYAATPSPYTVQPGLRPRPWGSDQQAPPRPQSMYYGSSPPIIEYGEEPIYTAIAPGLRPATRRPIHREPAPVPPQDYPLHPEDYYKMPPPPPKIRTQAQPQQRPPMARHAHTASDAHPPLRQRRSGHEESTKAHVSNRSPVKQSFAEHEPSRRPDARMSKKIDDPVPHLRAVERDMGRMNIESNTAKHKRRASVYGHESFHDLEHSVETYQAAAKGTPTPFNPIPIESLVRKKKPSSDTSSRHSGKSKTSREGSDVKSRRPSSEIKPRGENDGLAMRFNASQGINLDLKGGIEGRTISLRQSKDGVEGDIDLNIGSRGRAIGSRPPIAGREKSRRRYSYVDGRGGGVTEVERQKVSESGRPLPLRGYSYVDDRGVVELERARMGGGGGGGGGGGALERVRSGRGFGDGGLEERDREREREPRVLRERVVETRRSRRSSRSGFGGRE